MLFFAIPNFSDDSNNDNKPYDENKIHALRNMLVEQLSDVTILCTVVEYLNGFQNQGIDEADAKKYYLKISQLEQNQQRRFAQMDEFINENIIDIKKGRTTNRIVLETGKEVRKLEAGLRTLKLFAVDIIKILEPNSSVENRAKERLYYFNKRSAALEAEMKTLQERISYL